MRMSKKYFEYKIISGLIKYDLGYLKDYTEKWEDEGHSTDEYVYIIKTFNKSLDILIFSSISINANKSCRNDKVRVILKWKTNYGILYKKFSKFYIDDSLFNNLIKSIDIAKNNAFKLDRREFNSYEESMISIY